MEQEKKIIKLILSHRKTDNNKATIFLLNYEAKVRTFLYHQMKALPPYLEFEDIFYDAIVIFIRSVRSEIFVLRDKNSMINYITRICRNNISKSIKQEIRLEQHEKEFHNNNFKEFIDIDFSDATTKQKKGIKELILSINISPGCEKIILCFFSK